MDPHTFFTLAESLIQSPSEEIAEISYRTAINRLYYGVFHWIQQHYHIRVPERQVHRCHAYVKEVLAEQLVADEIIVEYNQLEQLRIESDYFIENRIKKNTYSKAKVIKETLLQLVDDNPDFLGFIDEERTFFQKRRNR